MADAHANFAYSTVATAPSPASSGTSLVVAAADGAKFPAAPFNATVWPTSAQPTTTNAEIVRVTAISTDTLTITRTQESTSARTIVIGDQIAATITAKTLTDVEQANSYLTSVDQVVAANTQAIVDDYLEVSASFVYELASGAELVVGDFATPLAAPDQNTNIVVAVADETVPRNSEIVFSDFYELSAPFVMEITGGALLQLGTLGAAPGQQLDYVEITANATVTATADGNGAAGAVIDGNPVVFDGATRIIIEFYCYAASINPTVAGRAIVLNLYDGTTDLGRIGNVTGDVVSVTQNLPVYTRRLLTPTNGTHTYHIRAWITDASATASVLAGPGGASGQSPAYYRITIA